MRQILEDLSACKDKIDGICFALHGAGCADGIDDVESCVLRRFREIVGKKMPIMVPMDLHGNISPEMASLATLFGVKHYPHIDCAETGALAMQKCVESIKKGSSPNTVYVRLPILLPCSAGYTEEGPLAEVNEFIQDCIKKRGLIDATLFQGFPYSNHIDASASVIAVSWDNPMEAAKEIAKHVWSKRDSFIPEILSPKHALDRARKVEKPGFIVINELSDNPGGGTPGDGTHLLREMLSANLEGSIFGFICDAEAVEKIFTHAPGDKIFLKLGGKTEPIHGEPVEVDAEIVAMSSGRFIYTSPVNKGIPGTLGKCARIRVDNLDIIVGSMRQQTMDDRPFLVTGADIAQYRYIGLKSTFHFRAFYQNRAAAIIATDPPGLQSGDLSLFDFNKIVRPIFPLDDVQFTV